MYSLHQNIENTEAIRTPYRTPPGCFSKIQALGTSLWQTFGQAVKENSNA